jgi:biopolymer transport protein ExbD
VHIQDEETWDEAGGLINVTPLVDVVFQLLLFFMLTTTFHAHDLEQLGIELPQAKSGAAAQDGGLVLEVHRDGSVTCQGRALTSEALRTLLEQKARADRDTLVTIRGDAQAKHESIVTVMDACGQAGLRQLAVGTLDRAEDRSTGPRGG